MARYNLRLPDELQKQVEDMAQSRSVTVQAIIEQSVKIGLIAFKMENSSKDEALCIRRGDRYTELMLI